MADAGRSLSFKMADAVNNNRQRQLRLKQKGKMHSLARVCEYAAQQLRA